MQIKLTNNVYEKLVRSSVSGSLDNLTVTHSLGVDLTLLPCYQQFYKGETELAERVGSTYQFGAKIEDAYYLVRFNVRSKGLSHNLMISDILFIIPQVLEEGQSVLDGVSPNVVISNFDMELIQANIRDILSKIEMNSPSEFFIALNKVLGQQSE